MDIETTVERRSYSLLNISEEEGEILASMLDHSNRWIRERLGEDELGAVDKLGLSEATSIGQGIRDKIRGAVVWGE